MARLLDRLPIINLWKWADGEEYTVEENSADLTPELAESDMKTDEAYDKRYRQQPKKGNGGKGKSTKFKGEIKVEQGELSEKIQAPKKSEKTNGKEIVD